MNQAVPVQNPSRSGGAMSATNLRLNELERLFNHLNSCDAPLTTARIKHEIINENATEKRTAVMRSTSFRQLRSLYILDGSDPLFQAFYFFWNTDESSRPLLAFMMAYHRDALLRDSVQHILRLQKGESITANEHKRQLESLFGSRFSDLTYQSLAQNTLNALHLGGLLEGRGRHNRIRNTPTPAATTFAAYINHLQGKSGEYLVSYYGQTDNLLSQDRHMALANLRVAHEKSWITFHLLAEIVDIKFQIRDNKN